MADKNHFGFEINFDFGFQLDDMSDENMSKGMFRDLPCVRVNNNVNIG